MKQNRAFGLLVAISIFSVVWVAFTSESVLAQSETGGIRGTVTAADTGNPLADVAVTYRAVVGYDNERTTTNTLGEFEFSDIPSGNYWLEFSTRESYRYRPADNETQYYQSQIYNGKSASYDADIISVTNGEIIGVDTQLARGSFITGTIQAEEASEVLDGIRVYRYTDTCVEEVHETTPSDETGEYILGGASAGTHWLYFCSPDSDEYVSQYYGNTSSRDLSTPIVTQGNEGVTDINFTFLRGGHIAGRVLATDTGEPLEDVDVQGTLIGREYASWHSETDEDGYFRSRALEDGDYQIEFGTSSYHRASAAYLDDVYPETVVLRNSEHITIADMSLVRGASIAGKITGGINRLPIRNIDIWAQRCGVGSSEDGDTNPEGLYSIVGLEEGTYQIHYNDSGRYDDDSSYLAPPARIITLGASEDISETLNLTVAGQISGTVVAKDSGLPIEDVDVYIRLEGSTVLNYGGYTDSSGHYSIIGLADGNYRLSFFTDDTYDVEAYLGQTYPPGNADVYPIVIKDATSVRGPDIQLERGGRISGSVFTERIGLSDSYMTIEVLDDQGYQVQTVETDRLGNYITGGLEDGAYYLRAKPRLYRDGCQEYAYQYNGGKTFLVQADPIVVAGVAEAADVNFELSPGYTISGKITSQKTGQPLTNIGVFVYDDDGRFVNRTSTSTQGEYTTEGLPPGQYRLIFQRSGRDLTCSYVTSRSYYGGANELASTQRITVAEENVIGIDDAVELSVLTVPSTPSGNEQDEQKIYLPLTVGSN